MSGHGADHVAGDGLRARFQPLLLTGAALIVLPIAVSSPVPSALIGVLLLAAGIGAVVAWLDARDRLSRAVQERLAVAFAAVAVSVYLWLLVATAATQPPQRFLPLAAALLCALVAAPALWLRGALSAVVLVGTVLASVAAGLAPIEVVLATVLLAAISALAWTVAAELRAARRRAWAERDAIARRSELLQAVRSFPQQDAQEAARRCCEVLRELGADAAGVSRVVGDELCPVHLVGVEPLAEPLRRDQGLMWRAIRERRTVVVDACTAGDGDGADAPVRPGFGSVVAVPLVTRDEVVGASFAAWRDPGAPTALDVELVEVLSAHLGAVTAAAELVARQRDLLARLGMLDRMRRELLGAMSIELRDPLTILRATVQLLDAHDDRLTADQRAAFLARLEHQTSQLRLLVDGILDFSRSPEAIDPERAEHPVSSFLEAIGIEVADRDTEWNQLAQREVQVDLDLVGSAFELLRGVEVESTGPAPRAHVEHGHAQVRVVITGLATPLQLVRSLATQMLTTAGVRVQAGDTLVLEVSHTGSVAPAGRGTPPAAPEGSRR